MMRKRAFLSWRRRKNCAKILALGDGGLRKNDAGQYLAHSIPARQQEDKLFSQARQASKKGDLNSLESASRDLLKHLIALEGPRKPEAEQLLQDVESAFIQQLRQWSRSRPASEEISVQASLNAGLIRQNGGDPGKLVSDIDQAEQNRLTQWESQFNQLKQERR